MLGANEKILTIEMKNLRIKGLIILHLVLISTFYACEDAAPGTEEVLQNMAISPNPFYDAIEIKIHGKVKGDVYYQIYTHMGKVVASNEFEVNSKKIYTKIIDLQELETGIYIIRIEYKGADIAQKLFKQDHAGA